MYLVSDLNVTTERGLDFSVKVNSNERQYLLMAAFDARCYLAVYVNHSQVSTAMTPMCILFVLRPLSPDNSTYQRQAKSKLFDH